MPGAHDPRRRDVEERDARVGHPVSGSCGAESAHIGVDLPVSGSWAGNPDVFGFDLPVSGSWAAKPA